MCLLAASLVVVHAKEESKVSKDGINSPVGSNELGNGLSKSEPSEFIANDQGERLYGPSSLPADAESLIVDAAKNQLKEEKNPAEPEAKTFSYQVRIGHPDHPRHLLTITVPEQLAQRELNVIPIRPEDAEILNGSGYEQLDAMIVIENFQNGQKTVMNNKKEDEW